MLHLSLSLFFNSDDDDLISSAIGKLIDDLFDRKLLVEFSCTEVGVPNLQAKSEIKNTAPRVP